MHVADWAQFRALSSQQLIEKYFAAPPYELVVVQRLIELGDVRIRPQIRNAYARESDVTTRLFLASLLVSLRDPDPKYYQVVADAAEDAVANDMPFPDPSTGEDAEFRGRFERWKATKSSSEVKRLMNKSLYSDAIAVSALAKAADPRSKGILRRGLNSPSFLAVVASTQGLARVQDEEAVRLIVARCASAPSGTASVIAKYLAYFESAASSKALERFVPNPEERASLMERAKKKGPLGAVFEE